MVRWGEQTVDSHCWCCDAEEINSGIGDNCSLMKARVCGDGDGSGDDMLSSDMEMWQSCQGLETWWILNPAICCSWSPVLVVLLFMAVVISVVLIVIIIYYNVKYSKKGKNNSKKNTKGSRCRCILSHFPFLRGLLAWKTSLRHHHCCWNLI